MWLYKDSYGINHRTAIRGKLKELKQIVKNDNYDGILLPYPRKKYSHEYNHISCSLHSSTFRNEPTEKQLCCCWNYFNKSASNSVCSLCTFPLKKKNVGKFEIVDYEVPSLYNMKNLGAIDWLLKRGDEFIATEVKPYGSPETIVRMLAEILTYTIGTTYIPAICFFKTDMNGRPTKQLRDYVKYKGDENFLFIKEKTGLKVLYITFDENTFCIHDEEEEPLE